MEINFHYSEPSKASTVISLLADWILQNFEFLAMNYCPVTMHKNGK